MDFVIQKYVIQLLKSRVNETWSDELWNLFEPVSKSFDMNVIYLPPIDDSRNVPVYGKLGESD